MILGDRFSGFLIILDLCVIGLSDGVWREKKPGLGSLTGLFISNFLEILEFHTYINYMYVAFDDT